MIILWQFSSKNETLGNTELRSQMIVSFIKSVKDSTKLPSKCFGCWTKPFLRGTAAFRFQLPGDHADEYQMSLSVFS